jgi:NADPH:quinone reductase-like Zn-dependent oxidoreductase
VLAFPINRPTSRSAGHVSTEARAARTPGAECVGRVLGIGAGVTHVKPGDLVINLQRENWAQRRRVKGDDVIAVSEASTSSRQRCCESIPRPRCCS